MSAAQGSAARRSAGRGFDWRRMPEVRAWSALALLFLYAPLLVLVIYAFNANRVALIWSGFSTQWFVKAFANEDLRRAAWNSVVVAAVATPVSTLLAIPAALGYRLSLAARRRAAAGSVPGRNPARRGLPVRA